MHRITVWKIALPTPLYKSFDYLPPLEFGSLPPIGARVWVPFGRRRLVGFFLGEASETEFSRGKLKVVEQVVDHHSLFAKNTFQLCEWMSGYYHHPLGEVLMGALPKYLREGNPLPNDEVECFTLSAEGEQVCQQGLPRAPKQMQILQSLAQGPMLATELKNHQLSRSQLSKLIEKGWVNVRQQAMQPPCCNQPLESKLTLNQQQQQALAAINNASGFETFLLAGVTGSGKTEVYLQAIAKVLEENKKALILIPEISLSPQTLSRFEKRFGIGIAVLHSGLSDKDRVMQWFKAYSDKVQIVIGTRSAIFAPLDNLGLVIVDEEHDASFKSQSQMRYSARDMAVMRGRLENIPVVLGSATPALESFYNVMMRGYKLLKLTDRAGGAKPPEIRLVDLRAEKMSGGFSQPLIAAIKTQLAQGKQVLVFLNRRGFAPVLLCHHCGFSFECNRCDAKLIYHKKPARLVCHHCDKVILPPRVCSKCHQAELITVGQGTEQLEATLAELFPQARLLRIDRDTVTTRHSLEKKLEQVHAGEADILIGTQMLAKGHHFPRLGLSAIIDIDASFFSLDFRALERMAQLLIQVAGRSGRGKEEGQVVIQTHQPDHPLLQILLSQGYFDFMQALLHERKEASLPPFSFQIMLRAESRARQSSINFLQQIKLLVSESAILALGPMPALMERKGGRFRSQLLLQSNSRSSLKKAALCLMEKVNKLPEASRIRWSIDVDPIEII